MVAEIFLAVLPPLFGKLTEAFLGNRHQSVDLAQLQEEVARLVRSQRELAVELSEYQRATAHLVRYVARSRRDVFVFHGGQLVLAEQALQRDDLRELIDGMGADLERRLRQRQARPPIADRQSASALDAFFDGFEEEVTRARLGHEDGSP